MLETDPSFRPVQVREGYPPLEDLGLIGDGATVALVGLDGGIHWMCLGGAQTWMAASGLRLTPSRRPDLQLRLRSSRPLSGLHGAYDLKQGDSLHLVLFWGRFHRDHSFDAETVLQGTAAALQGTAAAWRWWMTHFSYDGPQEPLVWRAAITLKLCDYWVNGSLVAAPTSSLSAPVGGVRNWDYRYTWIRDAAFTVFALRRIGFGTEADAFLGWVLDAFEQSRQPRIMYDLDGSPVPDEREDPELEGYRRSAPVRWGNGAADQPARPAVRADRPVDGRVRRQLPPGVQPHRRHRQRRDRRSAGAADGRTSTAGGPA